MRVVIEAHATTKCDVCSYRNPLPGLRHRADCVNCAAPIDVAGKVRHSNLGGLAYPFGGYYDVVAESLLYEGAHELEDGSAGEIRSLNLKKVTSVPCHCGAPLGKPDAKATDIRCEKCNDLTPVRWPDDESREWDPRITYIVGDAGDRGVALNQKMEGTVVACGSCGAPLAQGTRQRVVVCAHCKSENLLSDAIYTKLYPRLDQHVFHIVYDLDDEAHAAAIAFLKWTPYYFFDADEKKRINNLGGEMEELVFAARVNLTLANNEANTTVRAEIKDVDVARAIVSRTDLDEASVASLDRRILPSVKARIATHASIAFVRLWLASKLYEERALAAQVVMDEALSKCASDEDASVRKVVAARTDTPPEILAALRKDPNDDVRDAARANPSYQPSLLSKLFGA